MGGRHRPQPRDPAQGDLRAARDLQGGEDRVYIREKLGEIVIPRAETTTSGANFEILIGFEVTPQMAAFNRDGKRFRLNVGQASNTPTTP
jgi:hypothetical protein